MAQKLGLFLRSEENIKKNEDGANGDGGVCDVERRIAISAEPDFEKVRYGTMDEAIGKITSGSTDEESKARKSSPSGRSGRNEKPRENRNENKGHGDKSDFEIRRRRVGEHAEGNARILRMDEIDEVVDELVMPAFGGARFDEGFGEAVGNNNE